MEVHELTEAEREQMLEQAFSKMKIERKHLSQEELEKEIIDYLGKKQACSLATCGKDGVPRISVVDYVNDGLTIYIFSEGGDKFKKLKENNMVAIGIGTSAQTFRSVRGINLWGIAEVFTEDTPEFAHGMKLFSHIINYKGYGEGNGYPYSNAKRNAEDDPGYSHEDDILSQQ